MREYENQCVGCDPYCINCGRKKTLMIYCDSCEDLIENFETAKTYNNKDYCSSCADKVLAELIKSELNLNVDELTDEEYEKIREDYGFEKIDYIFENYR